MRLGKRADPQDVLLVKIGLPAEQLDTAVSRLALERGCTRYSQDGPTWQATELVSSTCRKRIKLHGIMPYRSVTLDRREGIATSATITRDDDSTDYGYLATVQGDPSATVDTPNPLLLVERNAKYTNGNPPVSAEELDQIAEGIARSIKRRPIQ